MALQLTFPNICEKHLPWYQQEKKQIEVEYRRLFKLKITEARSIDWQIVQARSSRLAEIMQSCNRRIKGV